MTLGLTTAELTELASVFQRYPAIQIVWLFGSRATGKHKKASDVDLALQGEIDLHLLAKIKYELEENTALPYFFDVVNYAAVDINLKNRIDSEKKLIYQR